jgi:MarR family transcriptional regulator, transcriptional regulator for hemolysin
MFAANALQLLQVRPSSASGDQLGDRNLAPLAHLGFRLMDAARLYTRRFQRRSRGLALDLTQCSVLLKLAQNEGVSQHRLAELVAIDPAALGRILDRLEARGWVERQPSPGERRSRSLAITKRARGVEPLIRKVVEESQHTALEGLSAEQTRILAQALDRILANLKGYEPGADASR